MDVVDLDVRDLSILGAPPFGGEEVYAVVWAGDDLLGACYVPPVADTGELIAHLVDGLGEVWEARAVAAAVGDPSAWAAPPPVPPEPVSVVVCTTDRPVWLDACLRSVRPQLRDGDELLVVDNSRAGSADLVANAAGARWVHEHRPGSSWARNRGVVEATTGVVVFIDDDCVADVAWLDALRAPLADPTVDVVTGGVLGRQVDLTVPLLVDERYPFHRGWTPARFEGTTGGPGSPYDAWRLGTGASMAWRRGLLERIGGFDPALGAGTPAGGIDDLDAFRRAIEVGAVFEYRPEALVFHRNPETRRAARRMLIRYAICQGAEAAKLALEEGRTRQLAVIADDYRWQLRWTARELANLVLDRERFAVSGLLAQPPSLLLGAVRYVRQRRALRDAV